MRIQYQLNGGHWNPKDEVKVAFYTELYHFLSKKENNPVAEIPLSEFVLLEPYIIGNLAGKYFLKEEIGGRLEQQPTDYFVGYLYHNNQFVALLKHLIPFFAAWREIERCSEPHAYDFFASSWASLVDTAKFFKYTTVEELERSPEAPSVRCKTILDFLQNCPDTYDAPITIPDGKVMRIPTPRKTPYYFLGWYSSSDFSGEPIDSIEGLDGREVTLYAKWETFTYFHSNDGYPTFSLLYDDFLNDFSIFLGEKVTKDITRIEGHGPVSQFCLKSDNGNLNKFFANTNIYNKWIWLVEYFHHLYQNNPLLQEKFIFVNNEFNDVDQVRWELNSLFVSRFHLIHPKTKDYSGAGIKEKLADSTNQAIIKVKYVVGEDVSFPEMMIDGYDFIGWFDDFGIDAKLVVQITDDRFAGKTLYAKWKKR